MCTMELGQFVQAKDYLQEALPIYMAYRGPQDPDTKGIQSRLALCMALSHV